MSYQWTYNFNGTQGGSGDPNNPDPAQQLLAALFGVQPQQQQQQQQPPADAQGASMDGGGAAGSAPPAPPPMPTAPPNFMQFFAAPPAAGMAGGGLGNMMQMFLGGGNGGLSFESAMEAAMRMSEGMGPQGNPPASQSAMDSLPTKLYIGKEMLCKECTVCMEKYEEGEEVRELPCEHVFHWPCLEPWLKQHNSCPTCRVELESVDQDYNNQHASRIKRPGDAVPRPGRRARSDGGGASAGGGGGTDSDLYDENGVLRSLPECALSVLNAGPCYLMTDRRAYELPCGCVSHLECLRSWARTENPNVPDPTVTRCPACRCALPDVHPDDLQAVAQPVVVQVPLEGGSFSPTAATESGGEGSGGVVDNILDDGVWWKAAAQLTMSNHGDGHGKGAGGEAVPTPLTPQRSALGNEPNEDDPCSVLIGVRMPDGTLIRRRFLMDAATADLGVFVSETIKNAADNAEYNAAIGMTPSSPSTKFYGIGLSDGFDVIAPVSATSLEHAPVQTLGRSLKDAGLTSACTLQVRTHNASTPHDKDA